MVFVAVPIVDEMVPILIVWIVWVAVVVVIVKVADQLLVVPVSVPVTFVTVPLTLLMIGNSYISPTIPVIVPVIVAW